MHRSQMAGAGGAGSAGGASEVEKRILQSNPVLEAFGNAKTHANDNSSRFGKLFQLQYDTRGERVVGATIQRYLLETSRVTTQQPSDRNYHIFYQLCRGADDALRARLKLPADSVSNFGYLSKFPKSTLIDGVDDKADFAEVVAAFKTLGFEDKEVASIWSVLAAVMHLGNVEIQAASDKGDSVVKAETQPSMEAAGELLGVLPVMLGESLTKKRFSGGRRTVERRARSRPE